MFWCQCMLMTKWQVIYVECKIDQLYHDYHADVTKSKGRGWLVVKGSSSLSEGYRIDNGANLDIFKPNKQFLNFHTNNIK